MTSSSTDLPKVMSLITVKPGLKFSEGLLKQALPDIESALFFAKVYDLEAKELGHLLRTLFQTELIDALTRGNHSTELQDYIIDMMEQMDLPEEGAAAVSFEASVKPKGEILPEVWRSLEVEVADSIKAVAAKLGSTVATMDASKAYMVFKAMAVMNRRRPVVGDFRAAIAHTAKPSNLVILDVSGSMSETTIKALVDDVVALSYEADAHLAIVSDTATIWEPGSFRSEDILSKAEYSGTHYETLAPLFQRDWGTVVTIADYDSAASAKKYVAQHATGRVGSVVDISLVDRPTFLGEVVGQLADEVKPILVTDTYYPIGSGW